MKTLIAIITLGTITLTQASAGDCHGGRSRSSNSYTRYYAPRPQYYAPSHSHYYQPRYTDRHHSYAAPTRDNHGHREDSHGHRVDTHGHHSR